jgi:pyridoxine 5-phosphate synthase
MAATEEMTEIATAFRPHAACIVPERREERTTEGGLNVAGLHNQIAPIVSALKTAGARVSLFIEPDPVQIAVAEVLGAPVVELHTGRYAELWHEGGAEAAAPELERLKLAAAEARRRGIEPHAGHGLTFENVGPVAAIPELAELNIGHFLVGEAIFIGLDAAIREMRRRMDIARA